MSVYRIKSFAKLNLALNITGKSTLLHKIESIFSFVELHDVIFVKKINELNHRVSFFGKFSRNINKNNTVEKLLSILCNKVDLPVTFRAKFILANDLIRYILI